MLLPGSEPGSGSGPKAPGCIYILSNYGTALLEPNTSAGELVAFTRRHMS
jgi:hypothetical protein